MRTNYGVNLAIILSLIFPLGSFKLVKSSWADCSIPCSKIGDVYTCTVASYDCINDAVTAALPGDTVSIVDNNSNIWATMLVITKGITLRCAPGAGHIISTVGTTPDYTYGTHFAIKYDPANPGLNESFRITGCYFDLTQAYGGIQLNNRTTGDAPSVNRIRIDHNTFYHSSDRTMEINGQVYGVVDNNVIDTFTLSYGGAIQFTGRNRSDWDYKSLSFGSPENIYFEDNTILTNDTIGAGGAAMRYVFRYNTITFGTIRYSISPIFDAHGNTTGSNYATMGVEIYGNNMTFTQAGGGGNLLNQRGGRAVCFYNKANNIPSSNLWSTIWEEEPDWHSPTNTICPVTDPNYANSGCDKEGYPEHVNNSYYWNNRGGANEVVNATIDMITGGPGGTVTWESNHLYDSAKDFRGYCEVADGPWDSVRILSGTGAGQWRGVLDCGIGFITIDSPWNPMPDNTSSYEVRLRHWSTNIVNENAQFWNHNSDFNGSAGIGCGVLANRPATCTTGVGYWATSQSCSNLTSLVGTNPVTPISGTLYKCTAPNVWTAYYTPYTYPHPLRTDCLNYPRLCDRDGNAPAAPTGLRVE